MERTIRGIHEMLRNGLKSIMNLKKEAKYTRCRRPVVLRYAESFESRQSSLSSEYEIKQLSRVKKEELIKKKA